MHDQRVGFTPSGRNSIFAGMRVETIALSNVLFPSACPPTTQICGHSIFMPPASMSRLSREMSWSSFARESSWFW